MSSQLPEYVRKKTTVVFICGKDHEIVGFTTLKELKDHLKEVHGYDFDPTVKRETNGD